MKKFEYFSYRLNGDKIHNTEFAEDLDDLILRLYNRGEYLDRVITSKSLLNMKIKLKSKDLADFCLQLGTMLKSGVSVLKSLEIIEETCILKKDIKLIYHTIYLDINSGVSLSNALLKTDAFPLLLINVIKASEENATLDEVLLKMSKYYENDTRISNKIKSAMIYPALLLCVTIVAIIGIFNFILPSFLNVLEGLTELPLLTKIVMSISKVFMQYGLFIILGIIGFIVCCIGLLKLSIVRYSLDRFKLQIPYVGKLLSSIYTYRFASTLSSMYLGGVSIVEGVNLSATTINNRYIESQLWMSTENLSMGTSLSESLMAVDGFHKKFSASIKVGEETGKLDELLLSLASTLETEANESIDRLISLLEPLTIIFLGILILPVILSVIFPMLKMYSSVGV